MAKARAGAGRPQSPTQRHIAMANVAGCPGGNVPNGWHAGAGDGKLLPMASASATPAVHALRRHGLAFTEHEYRYELKGGTKVSSRELGVPEHQVVKTLIMEDEAKQPLVVLMHGDREVSTKQLARQIGKKMVKPCAPEVAERHTGYQVGGTSPFGTRKALPIYVERSILALERIYLNGGRRGFLVQLDPRQAAAALGATPVDVAVAL